MRSISLISDDGEPLHVHQHGASGPAIVFLHGWTASHVEWSQCTHELAKTHRVWRWDARAHGGHPPATTTPPTVARMARDLDRMIDAFDLAGACFVGHSMGALTLWQYLRDFGGAKIGRLCCIDQSPKLMTDAGWALGIYGDFDRDRSARLVEDLRADFAEGVLRLSAFGLNDAARRGYQADGRGWQHARAALRAQCPEPLITCWQSLVGADYRDVVPRIDKPCLLIHGENSNFYPLATGEWLAGRIATARLSVYAGANHSPHLCDNARFVAELGAFVAA